MTQSISDAQLVAALSDPECPTSLWWEGAIKFPLIVMASPLFPLLTLEQPDRWLQLEEVYANMWMQVEWPRLARFMQLSLQADCAERCLPFFAQEADAKWLLESIWMRRQQAAGTLPEFWDEEVTLSAAWTSQDDMKTDAAKYAARAAGWSLTQPALEHAAMSCACARDNSGLPSQAARNVEYARERVWQWHRLLFYLNRGAL